MEGKSKFTTYQVLLWIWFASVSFQGQAYAVASNDLILCLNEEGTIDCSPGTINIIDSQFGRSASGSVACPHPVITVLNCLSPKLAYAQGLCQGLQTCDLRCVFSDDPCSNTLKYLNVTYSCINPVAVETTNAPTTTIVVTSQAITTPTPDPPTTVLETTTSTQVSTTTFTPVSTTEASMERLTTMNATPESSPIASTKNPSPEAVLEEFLAHCFGNTTSGEADVRPYRSLTFTSPGEDAQSRLAVNFESASLQTKPVKLVIAGFSEPKESEGCGSLPDLSSNETDIDSGDGMDDQETTAARSISSVVHVTVLCFNGDPLQLKDDEYVDVVFPAKIDFENEVPVCTSMRGAASDWKWTTNGCQAVYSNYTHVTCRCDHVAVIALERGPKGFLVGHINTIALLLIEKVLGGASVIGLLVVFMVYFILGNQHSQLSKIQLNIVMSCCFGHITYLVGMHATGNLYVCAAVAIIMQYLFTVYAYWLVIQTALFLNTCYIHGKTREGLHAALIPPKTYNLELVSLTKIFLAVWGLPVLVVGVLYKEYPYAYGTIDSCWLVDTEMPYIMFISSVALALLVNTVLCIITVFYLLKVDRAPNDHDDDDDYDNWIDKIKELIRWCLPTSVMLSAVLLVAWILHYIYQSQSSLELNYLFNICLMSQGILVFMCYSVFNPQLRTARADQYRNHDNNTLDDGTKK